MDILTFVSSLIEHLAWPLVALVALLVFRRTLIELLPKMRRAKWGDREIEFGEILHSVQAEASKLPLDPITTAPPVLVFNGSAVPSLAVLQAWKAVEQELTGLAVDTGAATGQGPAMGVIKSLSHQGVVDPSTATALDQLRKLRNVAAHTSDEAAITEADAQNYIETSQRVAGHLQWIRSRLDTSS